MAASMMVGGVVSAASLWGTYKGNDIVRLTSDGVALKSTDVPAINYEGRTMIPINMLGQIGLQYTWDNKNKTVDIQTEKPVVTTVPQFYGVKDIAADLQKYDITSMLYNTNGSLVYTTFYYKYSQEVFDTKSNLIDVIFSASAQTDSNFTEIVFNDDTLFRVPTQAIRNFYAGSITADQLASQYEIILPNNKTQSSSSTTTTTVPNQSSGNDLFCTNLKEQQAQELASIDTPSSWDGSAGYREQTMIRTHKQLLEYYGCS